MTENEAIKVLEKPSKHIRMVHKTENEMEFYTFSSDLVEAFETAIQALEKQIQKKPIDKLMYLECPSCGDVGIGDCGYCPCCGQKLDWQ